MFTTTHISTPTLRESEVGDRVTTRTVLGYVGTTGNAQGTPPHLHFGVYTFNGAINPLPLLTDRSGADCHRERSRARTERRSRLITEERDALVFCALYLILCAAVTFNCQVQQFRSTKYNVHNLIRQSEGANACECDPGISLSRFLFSL